MIPPHRRLRRRLMFAFAGFGLCVAMVFTLYALAFGYSAEDAFFAAQLDDEARLQREAHARDGRWLTPRIPGMRLFTRFDAMPAEVRDVLREEPRRTEIPGKDGRHYHLGTIADAQGATQAWLLYEVGNRLVVRPVRGRWFTLLAVTGLVMTLLALALGAWLAHRIASPLSTLSDAVLRMRPDALSGNVPHVARDDEVGVLARGLEDLVARVRDFIARERSFTRDASHELRTPLAVIRSAGERLAIDPGLSETTRRQLDHIRQSAAQLEQTVATLLAMAREHAPEDAEPQALLPVVERVIVEQSPMLGDREVIVDVDLPADHRVACARGVLHILLSNLIGNAFAHGTSGTVRIDLQDDRLRIANRGHAIPPELRELLHEPHRKREGSAGFGLGLSIAQRLCDHHGIALVIEHEDSGETRALVGFPRGDDNASSQT